jgi:hypothetical protein
MCTLVWKAYPTGGHVDISGQVLSVVGRNVNTKYGAKTVYDIVFSDGQTYSSWKADIATRAQQLQGQTVDARPETRGSYTDIVAIAPLGQLAQAAVAATGALLSPSGAVGNGAAPPIPIVASQGGSRSPEDQSRIVKQSCMKIAFGFIGALFWADTTPIEELTDRALSLSKMLYAEVYGQQNVAQTPTEVAAQVNQVIPEAVSVGAGTPDW